MREEVAPQAFAASQLARSAGPWKSSRASARASSFSSGKCPVRGWLTVTGKGQLTLRKEVLPCWCGRDPLVPLGPGQSPAVGVHS